MILCASDPIIQLTDSLGGTPDAGGVWTSGIGTVVPNTFDPATGLTDVYTLHRDQHCRLRSHRHLGHHCDTIG